MSNTPINHNRRRDETPSFEKLETTRLRVLFDAINKAENGVVNHLGIEVQPIAEAVPISAKPQLSETAGRVSLDNPYTQGTYPSENSTDVEPPIIPLDGSEVQKAQEALQAAYNQQFHNRNDYELGA